MTCVKILEKQQWESTKMLYDSQKKNTHKTSWDFTDEKERAEYFRNNILILDNNS